MRDIIFDFGENVKGDYCKDEWMKDGDRITRDYWTVGAFNVSRADRDEVHDSDKEFKYDDDGALDCRYSPMEDDVSLGMVERFGQWVRDWFMNRVARPDPLGVRVIWKKQKVELDPIQGG